MTPIDMGKDYSEQLQEVGQAKCLADNMYYEARNQGTAGIIAVSTANGGSLPEALGGIVIAGLLYVVVAIIFKFIDARILHKILPPFVTGPIIILIGLILAPVAINNANGTYAAGIVEKIGVNGCWLVALFTFAVAVFVKVFFEKTRAKLKQRYGSKEAIAEAPERIKKICDKIIEHYKKTITTSNISYLVQYCL